MARVSEAEVRAVFHDQDLALDAHINSAHELVQARLSSSGLSEDLLTEIEKWLAAHMAAATSPPEEAAKLGQVFLKRNMPQSGLGLESTVYGQRVMMLDTSGILSRTGRRKARIIPL